MVIAFMNTFFSFRSEPIVLTITTAVIGTYPLGYFMGKYLPDTLFHIPYTPKTWSFSWNPCSFTAKEHTLISIFASAASMRPGGIFVVNLVTIYFGWQFPMPPRLLFVLTSELLAFSFAGIMHRFLVEPAQMWWPASLVNVSLVRYLVRLTLCESFEYHPSRLASLRNISGALHGNEKTRGLHLIQFFYICLSISFAYYVLPGYLIPTLTSMSILCAAFPNNILAQQIGSGRSGLGIGAFSFDWASITGFLGSPLVTPLFAVANITVGFILQAYVLVPLTYWQNFFKAKTFPLFSTSMFNSAGKVIDISNLSSKENVYTSIFFAITCGQTFATFGASISHVFLFYGRELLRLCKVAVGFNNHEPSDIHTRLMAVYPPVPFLWQFALFIFTGIAALLTLLYYHKYLEMNPLILLIGITISLILLLPIGILMATTNQQPNLAIMSQYFMGYISPGQPIANVVFRTYSTVLCGRTITYLSNAKLGHYMKVPPKDTFIAQLIGTVTASITSTIVAEWLRTTVKDMCNVDALPADSPWTCPQDKVFYDQAIIWGIVGPQRMFGKDGPYRFLNWFMLFGFIAPVVVWLAWKAFPHLRWLRLVNMPLILQGAAPMPPASVVNNTAWIAVASFSSYYVYLKQRKWWQRYNHVLSASLDAGTALMGVLLQYTLQGKQLNWWGNNAECPVASCPTATGIEVAGCPSI